MSNGSLTAQIRAQMTAHPGWGPSQVAAAIGRECRHVNGIYQRLRRAAMPRLSVAIDADDLAFVHRRATERGVTVEEIIRRCVRICRKGLPG